MSPKYLEGIRRILTVSADTELVSAPSYLRAAQHAPALNNFGSAMSIIQDELAHAHIGYRLLGDLGVDMDWLIYERPAEQFKYPYAFDVPLNSWVELVCANALLRPGRVRAALRRVRVEHVRPLEAGAGQGRQGGDVPPAPRPHLAARSWPTPEGKAEVQAAVDWMFILTLEWFGLPDDLKQHSEQLDYGFKGKINDQLRQDWMREVVPFMDEIGIDVPAHHDAGEDRYVIDCPFPARFDEDEREWLLDEGAIDWDEVITRWRRARADEPRLRAHAAARLSDHVAAEGGMSASRTSGRSAPAR